MSYGAELGIHAYPGGGLRGGDRRDGGEARAPWWPRIPNRPPPREGGSLLLCGCAGGGLSPGLGMTGVFHLLFSDKQGHPKTERPPSAAREQVHLNKRHPS